MNCEYYYIDYRRAVDCTKYRIHMLDEQIKTVSKPTQERKDYLCPRCHSQWAVMEVLDSVDMTRGFLCKRCNSLLKQCSSTEADDIHIKFNEQFKSLLGLLRQMESANVPTVTGEEAVANANPVSRDEKINSVKKTEVMADEKLWPATVKGLTRGPQMVEVTICTEKESTAEQARFAEHKAKIATYSELPVWFTQFVVSGKASGSITNGDTDSSSDAANGYETADDTKTSTAELDAYFAALKEEQRRAGEEEEGEGDEDEDVMDTKRMKLDNLAAPTPPLLFVSVPPSDRPSVGEGSDADQF